MRELMRELILVLLGANIALSAVTGNWVAVIAWSYAAFLYWSEVM